MVPRRALLQGGLERVISNRYYSLIAISSLSVSPVVILFRCDGLLHDVLLVKLVIELFADEPEIVQGVGNLEDGGPEGDDVVEADGKVHIVAMSLGRRLEHFQEYLLGEDGSVHDRDREVKHYVVAEEHGLE